MSTGFAGSSTRDLDGFEREVETRMRKRLDIFTDDFDPPGTSEAFPGGNFNKQRQYPGKPHDDFSQAEDNSRNHDPRYKPMHNPGPKAQGDQEAFDALDEAAYLDDARIKPPDEQFPGKPHTRGGPRLKRLAEKPGDGPEAFNRAVERKLSASSYKDNFIHSTPHAVSRTVSSSDAAATFDDDESSRGAAVALENNPCFDKVVRRKQSDGSIIVSCKFAQVDGRKLTSGTFKSDNHDQAERFPDEGMGTLSDGDKRDEAMMRKHLADVDEAKWKKAKDASQEAFGKIKWPFVMWFYKEHGGK